MLNASPAQATSGSSFRAASALRAYLPAARRMIVVSAIAWWLGGFTFYAGVAVPVGASVLGSHKTVGFVTEHVTNWLNLGGCVALVIFLWNMSAEWGGRGKALRYAMLVTWLLMVAIQAQLIAMHPVMDRLLATQPHRMILDEDRFELLHRIYLISDSVQWGFALVHVWCICLAWGPGRRERISVE